MRHLFETSILRQAFYEGESTEGLGSGGGSKTGDPPKTYTQIEFEKAIETERKQNQERNRGTLTELQSLRQTAQLTEEQKKSLEIKIEELQSSLMTKEELQKRALEETEKKGREQVESLTKEVSTWKSRFENHITERALLDAAFKEGAHDPNMFIKLLRDSVITQPDETTGQYKVVVKMDSTKDGKPVQLTMNPDEAVKHMKSQSDKYGFLFQNTKNPGTGGNNTPASISKIDLPNMSLEQYKAVREQIMKDA